MLLVRWRKSYGAVIDESLKAAVVPQVPNQLLSQREGSVIWSAVARRSFYQSAFVGVAVKPVGKPDARNGHVRFDERGRETGRYAVRFRDRALPRLYADSSDRARPPAARTVSWRGSHLPPGFARQRKPTSHTLRGSLPFWVNCGFPTGSFAAAIFKVLVLTSLGSAIAFDKPPSADERLALLKRKERSAKRAEWATWCPAAAPGGH